MVVIGPDVRIFVVRPENVDGTQIDSQTVKAVDAVDTFGMI